ncbi:hypothetical protein CEXT_65011 [Caerostris extrusa]|uniref:Uncharacterized protein n=1 Tax=Caerostris extrusa TaxID=172846 RepID=A0AAV4N5I5_CAEEX|nr:hypothetical protein CEXT_65011 [Caerostris extrusa]
MNGNATSVKNTSPLNETSLGPTIKTSLSLLKLFTTSFITCFRVKSHRLRIKTDNSTDDLELCLLGESQRADGQPSAVHRVSGIRAHHFVVRFNLTKGLHHVDRWR